MIIKISVTTIKMVIAILMQQLNALMVYYIIKQSCANIYIFIANPSCISGSLLLVDKILKICVFGEWHTLCGNTWTLGQAKVACRQLGRNPIGMIINI